MAGGTAPAVCGLAAMSHSAAVHPRGLPWARLRRCTSSRSCMYQVIGHGDASPVLPAPFQRGDPDLGRGEVHVARGCLRGSCPPPYWSSNACQSSRVCPGGVWVGSGAPARGVVALRAAASAATRDGAFRPEGRMDRDTPGSRIASSAGWFSWRPGWSRSASRVRVTGVSRSICIHFWSLAKVLTWAIAKAARVGVPPMPMERRQARVCRITASLDYFLSSGQ